jgi:transposase
VGGLPTEALVAQVVVSKHADHLPLYRKRCLEHTFRRGPAWGLMPDHARSIRPLQELASRQGDAIAAAATVRMQGIGITGAIGPGGGQGST